MPAKKQGQLLSYPLFVLFISHNSMRMGTNTKKVHYFYTQSCFSLLMSAVRHTMQGSSNLYTSSTMHVVVVQWWVNVCSISLLKVNVADTIKNGLCTVAIFTNRKDTRMQFNKCSAMGVCINYDSQSGMKSSWHAEKSDQREVTDTDMDKVHPDLVKRRFYFARSFCRILE